jgi:hypothetical protein
MKLQEVLNKIVTSTPADWQRVRSVNVVPCPACTRAVAVHDGGSPDNLNPKTHTQYVVLRNDVDIAMAWGMTAGDGDYHEPWATCCPDPSAWTGFIDIFYQGTLVHRDVYVSVDGDRCCLPLPRSPHDLRVAPAYAQLAALISSMRLGYSDFSTYMRRTGLKLANLPWPQK